MLSYRIKSIINRLRGRVILNEPALNTHLVEFEIDTYLVSDFVITKLIPVVGIHPFPLNELMLMVAAVCRIKPTYIFEWGTNIGKSARIFYETIEHFKIKSEIHSIDLPDSVQHIEHPGHKRGRLVRNIDKVKLHQGDGLSTSLEILNELPHGARLLFFLDGDHSFHSVQKELQGIIQKYPQAFILIHDTFYQSPKSGYNIGPFQALCEEVEKNENQYKLIETKLGTPGMTLLYHK